MTLQEFVGRYNMHDSFIESMIYSAEKSTLTLIVNFAFWMQESYVEGEEENGLIELSFYNVTGYKCKNGDPTGNFVGILGTELGDGCIVINLFDDETDDLMELIIYSKGVIVNKL